MLHIEYIDALELGDGIKLTNSSLNSTPGPCSPQFVAGPTTLRIRPPLYPYYCPGSSGATYPIVTVSVLVRPAELITINTNW